MDRVKHLRSGPRAIVILALRGAIVALVSLPILVFAVQVQERLLGAPPPQVVAFLIGFVFAKFALIVLLGRMLDRVDPITTFASRRQSAGQFEHPSHARVAEVDAFAVHHRAAAGDHADVVLTAVLDGVGRNTRAFSY